MYLGGGPLMGRADAAGLTIRKQPHWHVPQRGLAACGESAVWMQLALRHSPMKGAARATNDASPTPTNMRQAISTQ